MVSAVATAPASDAEPESMARPDGGAARVRALEAPVALAAGAMGTRFELLVAGVEPGVGVTDARAACEAAVERIDEWHDRLTIFDPGSELSRINARAHRRPVALSDDLFELLEAWARLRVETRGMFDPACGALMRALGFRGERAREDAGSQAWSMRWIELDAGARTIRFTRPGVALDPGGIAKGLALDEAASILREAGVGSALIHGGTSSVLAVGPRPDGSAWRVRLGPHAGDPVACLRDAALAVSAPRGRTVEGEDGATIGHVLDPRTGRPAARAQAAAVVTGSAMAADAWATGLLVSGTRPTITPAGLDSAIGADGRWTVVSASGAIRSGDAGDQQAGSAHHE